MDGQTDGRSLAAVPELKQLVGEPLTPELTRLKPREPVGGVMYYPTPGLKQFAQAIADTMEAFLKANDVAIVHAQERIGAPKRRFGCILQIGPLAQAVSDEQFAEIFSGEVSSTILDVIGRGIGNSLMVAFHRLEAPAAVKDSAVIYARSRGGVIVRVLPFYQGHDDTEHARIDVLYC